MVAPTAFSMLSNMIQPSAAPRIAAMAAPSALFAPQAMSQMMPSMPAPCAAMAAPSAFDDNANNDLAEKPNNLRRTSARLVMTAAPSAFDDDTAQLELAPIQTQLQPARPIATKARAPIAAPPANFSSGGGNVEHSKRLRYDSCDYSAMAAPSAFEGITSSSSSSDSGGEFDPLPSLPSTIVAFSPRPQREIRHVDVSVKQANALSRTTAAALSDEARAFQHATSLAFNRFDAVDASLPEVSPVPESSLAKQSVPDVAAATAAAAAAAGAGSDASRARLLRAARTLLSWAHLPVDVVAVPPVRAPTTTKTAVVVRHDAPYAAGEAARLVAAVATLTDEAGDLLLGGGGDSVAVAGLAAGDLFVLTTAELARSLSDDDGRDVRLFVSSTFVDMAHERDVLIRNVFPSLHAFCAERGVRLLPMDLRWGITEEQSRQGSTIDICLREIDRARPYFLCMLGSRYGWSQPFSEQADRDDLLDATMERAARTHPWVARYTDRSVTELEVRHAVLNVIAPDAEMKLQHAANAADARALSGEAAVAERAIFFLRDDAGAAAMDKRLVRLRDEISQLGRTGHLRHVVHYAGDASKAKSKSTMTMTTTRVMMAGAVVQGELHCPSRC
jgi:hypothetical protein